MAHAKIDEYAPRRGPDRPRIFQVAEDKIPTVTFLDLQKAPNQTLSDLHGRLAIGATMQDIPFDPDQVIAQAALPWLLHRVRLSLIAAPGASNLAG